MAGRHRIAWTTAVRIWVRDRGCCVYCDAEVTPDPLLEPDKKPASMDHVVPKERGGQGTYENLVLSCRDCNSQKRSQVAPRGVNLQVGQEARLRYKLGLEGANGGTRRESSEGLREDSQHDPLKSIFA